jgi:hypothetical protein
MGGSRVLPGEVYLLQQPLAAPLSPSDYELLTAANVILYDRRLEVVLSEFLPIGCYAEPLSWESVALGAATAPRALAFARDGWKVLVLVAACGDLSVNVVDLRQRDAGYGKRKSAASVYHRANASRPALLTTNGRLNGRR